MKESRILGLCLFLVLIPAVALSATFEVTIDENGFNPSTLTINKGDTVRWVNRGTTQHSATSGTNGIANGYFDSSLLNPGDSFEYTPVIIGELNYFDKSDLSANSMVVVRGVVISPGDSVLLVSQGFDFVLFLYVPGDSRMSVILDGTLLYSGPIPGLSMATILTDTRAFATTIFVPPFTFSGGGHTLDIDVTAQSGELLSSERIVYTVLERHGFGPAGALEP